MCGTSRDLALPPLPNMYSFNNHNLACGVVDPVGDDEALKPNMLHVTTVRVANPVSLDLNQWVASQLVAGVHQFTLPPLWQSEQGLGGEVGVKRPVFTHGAATALRFVPRSRLCPSASRGCVAPSRVSTPQRHASGEQGRHVLPPSRADSGW